MLSFILLTVLLALPTVFAQTYCFSTNYVCYYSSANGSSDASFTIVVKNSNIKWAALGFGSSMNSAEVYAAWHNSDNTFTVSRKSARGETTPSTMSVQDQTIVSDSNYTQYLTNGTWLVTFYRPKTATADSSNVQVDLSTSPSTMIFAYGNTVSGSGASAIIREHPFGGYASSSVSIYSASSEFNISSSFASPTTGNGSASTGVNKRTLIIVHGILMFIAWQACTPIGIAIARFLKKYSWWFHAHVFTMFVGTTFLNIAAFFIAVSTITYNHFDASKYDTAYGSHVTIGLVIFILNIIQITSGYLSDKLWDKNRQSIPWWDKLHWWLGRITLILAVINVRFGFYLYEYIFVEEVSKTIIILYYIYCATVLILMIYFNRKIGQQHHKEVSDSSSTPLTKA